MFTTILKKYQQRNAALYSSNVAISGGSKQIGYRFSVGYDKSLNNTITSYNDRISLNSQIGTKELTKNLSIQMGLSYYRANRTISHLLAT